MEEAWQREHEASLAAWKLAVCVFSAPKKAERILRGNGARSQNLRELVLSDVLPPKGSGIFPSSTTNEEPRVHICEPVGIFSHLNSMCYPSIY